MAYHGKYHIKEGQESIVSEIDDIHDRIINLYFTRKNADPIVIHSDYEIIYHKDGTYSFKRCTEKPDIKISYKHVSDSVATEVDIEITNFNIGDRHDGSVKLMDSLNSDPATKCVIQMGYRKQFYDWTDIGINRNINDFFEPEKSGIFRNFRQLDVQILAAWQKSYPPDSIMYFKGIIGHMEKGLRWNPSYLNLVRGYGDSNLASQGFSEVEEVLFQFITKRFISNRNISYAITDREYNTYEDYERAQGQGELYSQTIVQKGGENIELVDGIMTFESARKYGVKCVVSEMARKIETAYADVPYLTEEENEKIKAAGGVPRQRNMFNKQIDVLGGQLVEIQKHYPMLRYQIAHDDTIYVYHVNDGAANLWNDRYFNTDDPFSLPAIYDMTPEGVRVIKCPFFTFIKPFMKVRFTTRHKIGTFVSYFYPVKTNTFLVISVKVEFTTAQDANIMELTVVDQPESETKGDKDNTTTLKVAKKDTQKRLDRWWIERKLTVVRHEKPNATETDSRVVNIVNNNIHAYPADWPDGMPTERDKLLALIDWNSSSWNTWLTRKDPNHIDGTSVENRGNGIGARYGEDIPWLLAGDVITIREPFLPEYLKEEKIV